MCVWHICTDVKLHGSSSFQQGVPEALMRPALTKTLISCLWYRWGRSSTYLHILSRWWEEAQPKNLHVVFTFSLRCCRNLFWMTICLPVLILESGLGYIGHFRKTVIIFTKYNHEIYFRSNYLDLLHVKGLSSWWISSRIILSSVCVCICVCVCALHTYANTGQRGLWIFATMHRHCTCRGVNTQHG